MSVYSLTVQVDADLRVTNVAIASSRSEQKEMIYRCDLLLANV